MAEKDVGANEDRQRVLKMLADGTITVDEAERLLTAMSGGPDGSRTVASTLSRSPKYLRIMVTPKDPKSGKETVNIRVPFQLVRAGAKFAAFLPKSIRPEIELALGKKGLDFDLSNLNRENVDELVEQLAGMSIDVDGGNETVRIFCE
jgi:hypothetical protein